MSPDKEAFTKRLIEVVTLLGYPERGRQSQLAQRYKIKQPSVRKWFTSEAMPSYEIQLDLCKRAMVRLEWLLSGRGDKYFGKHEIECEFSQPVYLDRHTGRVIVENPDIDTADDGAQ